MFIMTAIGPVPEKELYEALAYDIHSVDTGIDLSVAQPVWGTLLTLTRQGRTTKWRVWLYQNGESRLTHPETETLPAVDLMFEHGQHLDLRDHILYFIQRGWI